MTKDEFDREAEFHKTHEDSVNRLNDLRGDLQFGDIPLDADYWRAQNVHNALYGGKKE